MPDSEFSPLASVSVRVLCVFSLFDSADIGTTAKEAEEGGGGGAVGWGEETPLSSVSFPIFFALVLISAPSNDEKRTKPERKRLLVG